MALGYVFQLSASPGEERVASLAKYGVKIPDPAPARDESEAVGPFRGLVIENVMLVDGLGSPPRGPVNIHIKQGKIASIRSLGSSERKLADMSGAQPNHENNRWHGHDSIAWFD